MKPPLSALEATVWEYQDRVVAHCTCNLCGEKFGLTLRSNPAVMVTITPKQIRKRIFKVAWEKHDCDPGSYRQDPAETNRIVNKWHGAKLKLQKLGIFLFGRGGNA